MMARSVVRFLVLLLIAGFIVAIVVYFAVFMLQQSNAGDSSTLTLFSLCLVGGIVLLMGWLWARFIHRISRGMRSGFMQGYRRQDRDGE